MTILRPAFFIFFLVATALAAPVTNVLLESRGGEDIKVCDVTFRPNSKTTRGRCSAAAVYQLSATGDAVIKVDMTGKTVDSDKYKGDHVLELQVLKSVADRTGLCDVIKGIVAVDKKNTAKSLLQPAYDHVNAAANLFFLDKTVNTRKLHIVGNVLNNKSGGKAPSDNPDLNKAVKSYISGVGSNAVTVATSVTSDFAAIASTAQKLVDAVFPPTSAKPASSKADPAGPPSPPTAAPTDEEKKLKTALDAYKTKNTLTVSSEWNKVVGVINQA